MNLKVIRVGGTSYSGSTMLDLMLSNSDDAFSCGEVSFLFRSSSPAHENPYCACGRKDCDLWGKIKAEGEQNLFGSITSLMPGVNTIVDSSKHVDWFCDQTDFNNGDQFSFYNVLIWKTPEEYAYSSIKRGDEKYWRRKYINYHVNYFNHMKNWFSVKYSDLGKEPSLKLEKLCSLLNIPYFQGKEYFWNKSHHTLFGSATAKLHLFETDSEIFKKIIHDKTTHKSMVQANVERAIKQHRKIHIDSNVKDRLPKKVLEKISRDKMLNKICSVLELTEADNCNPERIGPLMKDIKAVKDWNIARRAKQFFLRRLK